MKLRFLTAFLILTAGWIMVPPDVQLKHFAVDIENSEVVAKWEAQREDGVEFYELHHRTPFNNDWVSVEQIAAHGASKPYRVVDHRVYKGISDKVDYRLEAVFTNGVRKELSRQSINYTSTAVRRTWGSIKAMFQ